MPTAEEILKAAREKNAAAEAAKAPKGDIVNDGDNETDMDAILNEIMNGDGAEPDEPVVPAEEPPKMVTTITDAPMPAPEAPKGDVKVTETPEPEKPAKATKEKPAKATKEKPAAKNEDNGDDGEPMTRAQLRTKAELERGRKALSER